MNVSMEIHWDDTYDLLYDSYIYLKLWINKTPIEKNMYIIYSWYSIYIFKIGKTQMCRDQWMNKEDVLHVHNGISLL